MSLKALLVFTMFVSVCVLCATARPRWHQLESYTFEHFKRDFGRSYSSQQEHDYRRALFEHRLENIKRHNRNPSFTWKRGVNHMSDWTDEEFRSMLGYKKGAASAPPTASLIQEAALPYTFNPSVSLDSLPSFIDWRRQGVVTDVKDQGQCGSCWSFATAQSVESAYALANNGQLHVLSEQQVLDCTSNPDDCGGSGGCSGGIAELGFAMIKKYGLASEWTYSYISYFGQNQTCQVNSNKPITPVATISGYVKLPSNEYSPLMQAVATVGPIAISVEAYTWMDYETGVFNGCNKTNPDIDHAVQLVGYGTDQASGLDYWLVRNSWSPAWGEQGYLRILRQGPNASCGMDLHPQDGSGCKNATQPVKVCGTCGILYDTSYPVI